MNQVCAFVRRQPIKTMLSLVIAWFFLAALNYLLKKMSIHTDTPTSFPISEFYGPTVHIHGLPYVVLFLAVLLLSLRHIGKLSVYQVWLAGFAFIALGNLVQGDFDAAFLQPLSGSTEGSGVQYYHDAITITSWSKWLENFNINQADLLTHSRTHPPFAVLTHYFLLQALENSTTGLSLTFALISSLTVPIMWYAFKVLEVPVERRNTLAVLFSVIPAINIYTAVSLDGLILTTSSLFLIGLVLLVRRAGNLAAGIVLCIIGFVFTNLLTYGGVFLLAVAGLLALREIILRKAPFVTVAAGTSLLSIFLVILSLEWMFGYSHIQGLLTASSVENPNGFIAVAEPVVYLMTRIEGISEILLFFSLGCTATLLTREMLGTSLLDFQDDVVAITIAGISSLMAMFLAGAFRTGETARVCLFIYPYLMLPFFRVKKVILRDLVVVAGIQTAGMQLFGGYFW
jgi:hypothetical protein